MRAGDKVWVYPHGAPEKRSLGTVAIISANQRSIAIGFGDPPAEFRVSGDGIAIHPEHGVMLLGHRAELNGQPWGPWVEMFAGGHFEIDETDDASRS